MTATMKILYGPPGTGKTWKAAREAIRAVDRKAFNQALASADPDAEFEKKHASLVKDGRIVWVTFHPSYSYEDFEGVRPIVNDHGQLIFVAKVVDGPFKWLCARAKNESDLQIGENLANAASNPSWQVIDKDPGGWMIQVRPDRKDQVGEEQDRYVSRLVLQRVMNGGLPPQVFSIPGKGLLELKDYGLNPSDPDVPAPNKSQGETTNKRTGSTIRRIVGTRTRLSSSDLSNSAHFGAVYRRLLELRSGGGPSVSIGNEQIDNGRIQGLWRTAHVA